MARGACGRRYRAQGATVPAGNRKHQLQPPSVAARGPIGAMGKLRRSLGLGSLAFYGVGVILGAGIYSILGEAAGIAAEALW